MDIKLMDKINLFRIFRKTLHLGVISSTGAANKSTSMQKSFWLGLNTILALILLSAAVVPPTAEASVNHAIPLAKVTPTPKPKNDATHFFDDFSNFNGPWENVFKDNYSIGYFQKGNYAIALRVPLKMAMAFPPYKFKKPIKNMLIGFKAQGEGDGGSYGLLCHYQDKYNYYRVSFSGSQPYWKDILDYETDEDGYIHIQVACTDGRIQVLVNDMGQVIISDEDLNQGDALLFAASGDQKNEDGTYEAAYFDDFSAEIMP
jgi:hypothetical protein